MKKSRRLLVVEDNPRVLEIYVKVLEDSSQVVKGNSAEVSFEVLSADTFLGALHIVQRECKLGRPLVGCFVDSAIDGLGGAEIVSRLRRADPGLTTVLCAPSASRCWMELQRAFQKQSLEQRDYLILEKPLAAGEILQTAHFMAEVHRKRQVWSKSAQVRDILVKYIRRLALARELGDEQYYALACEGLKKSMHPRMSGALVHQLGGEGRLLGHFGGFEADHWTQSFAEVTETGQTPLHWRLFPLSETSSERLLVTVCEEPISPKFYESCRLYAQLIGALGLGRELSASKAA